MIPFSRISILSHLVGPQVHFGQLLQLVFVVSLYFLVQVLCAYHMAKREPTSRRNQPRQSSFLDKARTNVTVGGSNQTSGIKYDEKILCQESNGVARLILGTGFPSQRLGPWYWSETIGAKKIVERLETYESLSPRFKAPQMLIQLARTG